VLVVVVVVVMKVVVVVMVEVVVVVMVLSVESGGGGGGGCCYLGGIVFEMCCFLCFFLLAMDCVTCEIVSFVVLYRIEVGLCLCHILRLYCNAVLTTDCIVLQHSPTQAIGISLSQISPYLAALW
jgi:hypothetical protein